MKKIYSDQDLLNALKKGSKDGMMGPTYHGYLKGSNRPSAEAIRARFGGWTNAVRKAGMIPAARRTKNEMRKLVKLGKVDAKYPALRMGMSVRELKVSVGLEKPRKPTRDRYIDEGVRIARKLGRAPNFHEFNRFTKTVTAWNPYRLYGRDWKAFKRDVEKRMKEKGVKMTGGKAKPKPKAKPKARPKAKAKAKAKLKVKAKARPKAKVKAKPKVKAKARPKAKAKVKARPKVKAKARPKAKAKAKPKAKARPKTKAKAKPKAKARPKTKAKSKAKAKKK